jgi:hypothetical protein
MILHACLNKQKAGIVLEIVSGSADIHRVGAFKHSWPLQALHEGGVGNAADQTFDLPIFFADVVWSEQLKLEFAQNAPIQRLRDCNAFNPMLWTS